MSILILGKRGIFMQEEKVQVSEREFNPNHGSLKAIFTLNVINVISFLISIFATLFRLNFLYYHSQEEMNFIYGIVWAIIGYLALMMILSIALRHVFLSKENVGGAIAMSVLFGVLGANIFNIVCGIILANSDFYTLANDKEQKEIAMNKKPLSWYKSEVERLKDLLVSDVLERAEILEQLTSIRSTVLGIQNETSGKLNSLDARIAKLGLSKAMEEEKYHLLSDYNFCEEIINLIDSDLSNQNVSSYEITIEEICKKSLELPEEKKVIFDEHKKYLDDNIYTPEEFVKKVSILFK